MNKISISDSMMQMQSKDLFLASFDVLLSRERCWKKIEKSIAFFRES